MARRPRELRSGALVILLAIATACGTNVPRDEIVAAAGGAAIGPAALADAPADGATSAEGVGPASTGIATGSADANGGVVVDTGTAPGAGPAAGDGNVAPEVGAGQGGGGGAATLSPVRLGHIGTYSGLLGAIFAGGRETLQAWARYTNANGGLNGHVIEVVTADDGGDPSRALSLARDMVENQGVIAFVGNIQPLSILGIRSYLEERRIPAVGGDLTDVGWFSSPMFFPQGGIVSGTLAAAARPAVQTGGPRIGVLYCGEANACFTARDVFLNGPAVGDAGGSVTYSAQISLAQPAFTAECVSMRDRVDAVIVAADGNTLSRLARDCRQQGVTPTWVSFGLALVNTIASDANLDGLVGTNSTFPWMLTDGPAAGYGAAMATYADDVVLAGVTSAVWSAAELMRVAGAALPAENPTSADVLAGLYALRGETIGGLVPPLTYNDGAPATPIECYWPIDLNGGSFGAPLGFQVTCN